MDGAWPNNVGLKLAEHTMVICSTNGAANLLGYVQKSQRIRGVWHYSVALAPVKNLRSNWILVDNVNPSQLVPVGMSETVPGLKLDSTARIASSRFRYEPQQTPTDPYGAVCLPVCREAVAPDRALSPGSGQPAVGCSKQHVKESCNTRTLTTKQAQKPEVSSSVCVQMGNHRYKICIHGRRETACVLYKGGSICAHNRQRYWCKECGGKAWCQHGKQKSRCVDCGGKGVCQHGRLRGRCEECNKVSK